MFFDIEYYYTEKYKPTKRHRNLRERSVKDILSVEVTEPVDFPIAFIVKEYQSVYEHATSYNEFNGPGDYRMFAEEIRTYNGNLYKPVRVTHGAAISLVFENMDYIVQDLKEYPLFDMGGNDFSEESIVVEDNRTEKQQRIIERAASYVIYNNVIWKQCGEPMYNVVTFGLGHNHGGTGFFVTYHYNPNISKDNYFNALQRDEAISYGKQVALNRGDTESVDRMGNFDIIEVMMPELVTRNPQAEHGEGDPFINSLNNIVSKSSNSTEAGLLALAFTAAQLKQEE